MLMISENLWNEIKDVIPVKKGKVGRPQSDPRTVLSGVFYIMLTGAQWHQLPDYYGRPTTVYGRFRIWVKSRIFHKILSKSIDVTAESNFVGQRPKIPFLLFAN